MDILPISAAIASADGIRFASEAGNRTFTAYFSRESTSVSRAAALTRASGLAVTNKRIGIIELRSIRDVHVGQKLFGLLWRDVFK